MSVNRCCHVKLNGARCTMPTFNNNELCFSHDTRRIRARIKPCAPPTTHWTTAPLFELRYPETYEDIIDNGHSALDAFVRHQIDFRQLAVVTRHMELIRKSLASAERHNKIMQKVIADNMVQYVRYDEYGNADAVTRPDTAASPQAAADPEPVAQTPEPITISTLSAQAAEPVEPDSGSASGRQPSHLRRVTNSLDLSRLLSTLAQGREINILFSNTYKFCDGKLICGPMPAGPSEPNPSAHRSTAYIFLTNMR